MGKAYSLDFKQQVLKSFKLKKRKIKSLKKSIKYINNQYLISERTLYYWLKQEKEQKLGLINKRKVVAPYKIDIDKLNQLNQDEKENYTLKELANILNVSDVGVLKYFKKNKITFKKKNYGIQKVIQQE